MSGREPEPESYEHARAELEEVVRRLEAGGVPLEESLTLWERGEALARRCEQWLDGACRRLEQPPPGEPTPPTEYGAPGEPSAPG